MASSEKEGSMRKGLLIVISGPSGSGKTTVCRKLLEKLPGARFSISATTREQRNGETNGCDYYFISQKEFKQKIRKNEFLEWAKVYDQYYGTLKKPVLDCLKTGTNVLLDIDMQGALSIKKKFKQALLIFILPPSLEELKKRLTTRNRESAAHIKKRMREIEAELAHIPLYDLVVINDNLQKTLSSVIAFIKRRR